MVQLEEVGQLVRVRLAALQLGDERQLALDEALAAAREVGEHRVDVAAEEGLLGGEADGLAVHHVEGVGHVADLVRGVDADRFDGDVDVVRVGLGERLDQLGQSPLGDVLGRGLEPGQRAHHRAGDQTGATEGDEQHQRDGGTDDQGLGVGLGLELLGLSVEVLDELGLDPALGGDLGGGLLVPVLVADDLALVDTALLQDRAGVAVGRGDDRVVAQLAAQVVQVVRGVDVVEAGQRVVVGRLQPDAEGLVAQAEVRAAGVGERGADQRALLRGGVLGERELLQGTGRADQLAVVGRERDVLGDRQQVADDHVVGGDRRLDVLVVLVRVATRVGDRVQVLADLEEQGLSAGEFEVLELVRGRGEGAAEVVGDLAGGDDVVVQRRVGLVGHRPRADVPLVLQGVGEVGRLLGQVGEVGHLGQLLRGLERGLDAQATEDQRDHDREREQGDQLAADPPVAHGEPAHALGPAAGQRGPELAPGRLPLGTLVLGSSDHVGRRFGRTAGGHRRLGGCHRLTRLRVTRAAATPFETSLHWRRNLWTGRPAASPQPGRCGVSIRTPAGPGERAPGWSTPYPRSVAFQHSRGIPTRASGAHRTALPTARGISRSVRQPDLNTAFFGHSSDTCQAVARST